MISSLFLWIFSHCHVEEKLYSSPNRSYQSDFFLRFQRVTMYASELIGSSTDKKLFVNKRLA